MRAVKGAGLARVAAAVAFAGQLPGTLGNVWATEFTKCRIKYAPCLPPTGPEPSPGDGHWKWSLVLRASPYLADSSASRVADGGPRPRSQSSPGLKAGESAIRAGVRVGGSADGHVPCGLPRGHRAPAARCPASAAG